MNAELIAVGTEILLGDIVNTDAQVISRGLAELGIGVYYQTVVGDNPERLRAAICQAKKRADIIITTGGLGPTLDDLTKETLAAVFEKKMELDEASLAKIKEFFARLGREMTANNEKQAMLPVGCTVFQNDWGTAPGCAFEAQGVQVVMLPGPPRECEPMFRHCAMPYLAKLCGGTIVSHNLHIFGMGESEMEAKLFDLMEESANPTLAPYAKENECLVRVTARAETAQEAEALIAPMLDKVRARLGDVVYSLDVPSLEQVVADGFLAENLTLSVAESCTGGLLSKRVTDIPGASGFYKGGVCSYCNEIKVKLLGVKEETLASYTAVSEQTAREMAEGVRRVFDTDYGVGITGLAGPGGGLDDIPEGTVFVAVSSASGTVVRALTSALGRSRVRNGAASNALDMLRREILEKK